MYFTKISEHKKGKPSKLFPHVCSPEQGDMMAHPLQLQHLQQELHWEMLGQGLLSHLQTLNTVIFTSLEFL